MDVIFEDIKFKNPDLGETVTTEWLMDNITEVVDIEIHFRYQDYLIAQSLVLDDGETTIVIRPSSTTTGFTFDDRMVFTDTPGGFENYNLGDSFTVFGSANNNFTKIILEIPDGQTLVMTTSWPVAETLPIGATAYNSTPIEAVEYLHNLIENEAPVTYESLTDGSTQRARAAGLDSTVTSNTPMVQLGNKSYQYGSLQIRGNNTGDSVNTIPVSQGFIISHTILIAPLFLSDQIDDLNNNVPPSYFLNDASLKYVFKIEASKNLTDPNAKKIVIEGESKGNVGWFDENLNTGLTNYSSTGLTYKRADLTVNTAIELITDETTIEFDFFNTTDTPFSDGNTKLIFSHFFAPIPETEYRRSQFPTLSSTPNPVTGRLLEENFIYDRIVGTLGVTSTTPDNLGKTYQVIKQMESTFISPSQIKVKITIALAPEVVSRLGALTDRNYVISLATKSHLLDRDADLNDKVNLKIDKNEYFIDNSDPNLFLTTLKFMEHPKSDIDTESITFLESRMEDDIVGIADIDLDKLTRETDEIIITSMSAQIMARKVVGLVETAAFELDGFGPVDLSESLLVSDPTYGNIPNVDFTENRGFKTPADENRGTIKILRRFDLDSGGKFRYQLQLPWVNRWEDWEELAAANSEFFDNTLQNDGLNHDWFKYGDKTDWGIYYRVTINSLKNGEALTPFVTNLRFYIDDYLAGPDWDTENTTTKDPSGTPILIGGNYGLIVGNADTTIEANKTYIAPDTPTLPDLAAVMKINVFEKDNFLGQYTLSSVYDMHPDSWLKSIGITNRVVITDEGGGVFRASCLADGTLLPDELTFKFTTRFYDLRDATPFPNDGKLQEDGSLKLQEDGFIKLLDP